MNNEHHHWFLQQIDIFKGISDDEILNISSKVTGKKCSKNEYIYMLRFMLGKMERKL